MKTPAATSFAFALLAVASVAGAAPRTVPVDGLGNVSIFASTAAPAARVVLFLSGEDGWTDVDTRAAQTLADAGALVAGVDGRAWASALKRRPEKCVDRSADLGRLGRAIERDANLPGYLPPLLVGRGSGATIAYAALAQASTTTFSGAISLGFCPTVRTERPYCRGLGLDHTAGPRPGEIRLLPTSSLESPWIVIEAANDGLCDERSDEPFVKHVFHGDIVFLPGGGAADEARWLPALRDAAARATDRTDPTPMSQDASTKGLPLIEARAKGTPKDVFAVIVSGDGGWAVIDRALTRSLTDAGVDVVGVNSLRYFWKRRTPDETGHDLERVLRHYFATWKKSKVILIGYSRGADVMPFMANRLPADLQGRVSLIALLGLESAVEFEIHAAGTLFNLKAKNELPIRPELDKLPAEKIACYHGEDEEDTLCRELKPPYQVIGLKGGHHFGGAYTDIAADILRRAK